MKKLSTFLLFLAVLSSSLTAQFSLTTVSTPVTEDFTTYTSVGIQPTPAPGELNSNSFSFTGFSDGAVAFGGTNLTLPSDYARGPRYSNTPVTGGGMYAYMDTVTGDHKLWIQPTTGDFTPGEMFIRVINNTGAVLNDVQFDMELTIFNDSIHTGPGGGTVPTRSQSLELAFSTDSINYNVIASDTTPGYGDGQYYTIPLSYTLNGLNLANGQAMFIRFATDDHSGAGSRDELGLDNISFTALPPSANATLTFGTALTSVAENAGIVPLTLNQTFAVPCSVDVMVTGGTANNPADFTFAQTLVFDGITPSANLDLTIIDDLLAESTEDATLMMMNATAGCQISILNSSTLEITDNEIGLAFAQATGNTNEGAGTVTFDIVQSIAAPCSVEVALVGGTAINPSDFTFTSPTLVVFDGVTTTQSIPVSLIDDAIVEGAETAVFTLQNATGGCVIGLPDTLTAVINDNDFPIYPIGLITTQDANGMPDSMNVRCRLLGTVYGVNYRAGINGLQFSLKDASGSIWAMAAGGTNFGYTVNEGDSIRVQGIVTQVGGSTQFNLDSLIVLPISGTIQPATVVTSFVEANEADLIKLNNFYLVDAAQWIGGGFGGNFIVQITNGTDTFSVRIDNDIDAFNMPAPTCATFNVTGLLNQYDNVSPYTTGYQLLPRMMSDIECILTPEVSIANASATVNENVGTVNVAVAIANADANATSVDVTITGTATSGTDYTITPTPATITFPAGSTAPITFAVNITDDALFEPSETITFTLSNPTNGATITSGTMTITITDNDPNAIADGIDVKAVNVFPNPGNATLTVKTDEQVSAIEVINAMGQTVLTSQTVNAPISTANLASGIYTVRVMTSKGSWLTKWVKN